SPLRAASFARKYNSASFPHDIEARLFQWKPTFSREAFVFCATNCPVALSLRRFSSESGISCSHWQQRSTVLERTFSKSYCSCSSLQSFSHSMFSHKKG